MWWEDTWVSICRVHFQSTFQQYKKQPDPLEIKKKTVESICKINCLCNWEPEVNDVIMPFSNEANAVSILALVEKLTSGLLKFVA